MIIQCNSCQKSFSVPDGAITMSGRLVQCGSCGNKWTQFPIKEKKAKKQKEVEQPIIKQNSTKLKTIKKKTKTKTKKNFNPYSEEYLRKKQYIDKVTLTDFSLPNVFPCNLLDLSLSRTSILL